MDDMGYADPSGLGGPAGRTPHLERLAPEGMRLTGFYASQAVRCVSRASLLAGCYANRVGVLGALGPGASGLAPDEETIADVLKAAGHTCGTFGRWHLGDRPCCRPPQPGFDEYFGLPYSNDMWPLDYDGTPIPPEGADRPPRDGQPHRRRYPPLHWIEGNECVREVRTLADQDEITTAVTERAVRFIERYQDRRFFLYVAHPMVRVPLGVSSKFRGGSGGGLFGDVMMEIDWSMGEIIAALRRHGLERSTLVVFSSDNGPWLNFGHHAGSARPFRDGKGTMWEGGRVPCIAWWPGRIASGRVCERMAATIDVLLTFAALAGAPLPQRPIDGVDISPLLFGVKDAAPRTEYWYYYGHTLTGARSGDWKLMLPHRSRAYGGFEPGRDGRPGPTGTRDVPEALYNLAADPGETVNELERHPDLAARLRRLTEQPPRGVGG